MKKRPIRDNEEYIREIIYDKYKMGHIYSRKVLFFFVISAIASIFFSINIFITLFSFISVRNLIVKLVVLLLLLIYAYISVRIIINNKTDILKNNSSVYKKATIFLYETELIDVEFGKGNYNDLAYVLDENNKKVFGILYSLEEILENDKKCFLVDDPVDSNIKYVMPIRKYEEDKYEE